MTVGSADIAKAFVTAWDLSTLDATFQALWDSGKTASDYVVLHDQEAGPDQPFPYCVMGEIQSNAVTRMGTRSANQKREIRDAPVTFNVFARQVDGDSRSAKEIANYLVEEVMKVFGGHSTDRPWANIILDNGEYLITQYDTDYGVMVGDEEYQWVLRYNVRADVPVAV